MFRLALHWQILIGMILGAAIGITVNRTSGERTVKIDETDLPKIERPKGQRPKTVLPAGVSKLMIRDTPDRIDIEITDDKGLTRLAAVDATDDKAYPTTGELKSKDAQAYELLHEHGRSTSRWIGDTSQSIGGLFLRMLRMVAVPLIVASLITGIMSLGSADRLGKMFGRTLLYYVCTSMLAIVTGLILVNVIRPGLKGDVKKGDGEVPAVSSDLGQVLFEQLETMIPTNPIKALAEGNFLSIICFSIAFAIFALIVGGKTADVIREFFKACFDVMMAMTMTIIKLAPLGVFFLMIYVTATQGPEVFRSLAWYMVTVASALLFHAVVVLPLILRYVARRNPLDYARAMSPALLTAFSSASSNATLPLTMSCVEERAGVSNRVSSFVLPLGATVNMDGTALYESIAVLFIAQIYYAGNLELSQQIVVAITALLASIGAAGIPHAGLVMMVIILQAVGLPLDMQAIIIGVDRVLDMLRTSVNVWSDSCGCAVIARFEAGGGGDPDAKPSGPMDGP